jgi:hypothetical protein
MRKQLTFAAAIIAAGFIGLMTPRASFADSDRHGDGYRAKHAVIAVLGTLGHLAKGGRNGHDKGYVNDGGHGRKGHNGYKKHDGHGGKHAYGGKRAYGGKHAYGGQKKGHGKHARRGHHKGHGKHARRGHQRRHGHFARRGHGGRHGPYFAGRGCHQVSKIRHDGYGGRKRIVGTMCYDRYGNSYIVPGSRHVAHRY